MADTPTKRCLLCPSTSSCLELSLRDLYKFENCRYCGTYFVERNDYDDLLNNPTDLSADDKCRLSSLNAENEINGYLPFFLQFRNAQYATVPNSIPIYTKELLRSWPRSTLDRLDRTICNLGRMSYEAGHHCSTLRNNPAITFAQSENEADIHERYLLNEGLIEESSGFVILTIAGWRKYEELTKGASSHDNPVFVAMWFGDDSTRSEMTEIFTDSITPTIESAGYRCKRADSEDHNDFIMDVVLGSIRMAPFVVADFTGNRNGVYLEAGFARGLGIPVIHTCREDHFDDAHFDIQQINTIQWKTQEDLKERLYNKILATIGEGPGVRTES